MSLGDHMPDPATGARTTQHERFRQIVDYATYGEEYGFDAFHLGEHHFCDYIVSVPQIMLASVAEHTERMKLSTGVTLLPHHDAVRIAEDYATLDVMSGGRAELVIGRGVVKDTYRQMGQNIDESREMSDEGLDLLFRLWTEEDVTWDGKYRPPLYGVTAQPRPVQKPRPRVFMSGGSPDSVERAGELGLPITIAVVATGVEALKDLPHRYRDAYRKAGHDPAGMEVHISVHMHVDPDSQQAKDFFGPHQFGYLNWVAGLVGIPGFPPSHTTFGNPDCIALAGSPQEMVDELSRWADLAGGIDRLIIQSDQGGMPPHRVRASVELFAAEVMPALNAVSA